MGRSLSSLEARARASAERRGHDLTVFAADGMRVGTSSAECLRTGCDAYVIVEDGTAPNGVDIAGSAVSTTCPTRSDSRR